MNIAQTEKYINELLDAPLHPLDEQQRQLAYEFAVGLFAGAVGDVRVASPLTLQQVQGMHTLSQKQTFFLEYFDSEDGKVDAELLGVDGHDHEALRRVLADTAAPVTSDQRKQIAERSTDWARDQLVQQLAQSPETDETYQLPTRITINYDPDKILAKAEAVQAYRAFYRTVLQGLAAEPDQTLAEAERALIHVHMGRLNTMAAVDVLPGLLSLEEQLTHNPQSALSARLAEVAPAVGAIHDLSGEERLAARDAYAKHLDAIRQGAPYELDEVNGDEATLFGQNALKELADAIQALASHEEPSGLTELGQELEGIVWTDLQIKLLVEAVLRDWGMLSVQPAMWQEVDDRDGFAPDGKFQVVITPRRKNMSVDSTRRIVNIPEGASRPLTGLYPAGVLPLVAHELGHVLQAYADYELGEQIPLARIKGRRYRILREAGGAYQEKILCRDYLGAARGANGHYLSAYVAKMEGKSRVGVARVFYESVKAGRHLSASEDTEARAFAVNRTARLYRYGGHNSQVLDYVEQSIVRDILMQRLSPEQVDAFLLGSASFSLEDSALLHQFGLLSLPTKAAFSPAHDVMRIFQEQFYAT
jgi:hypothetical protein